MIEHPSMSDAAPGAASEAEGPAEGCARGALVLEDGSRLELRALIPLDRLGAVEADGDVVALDGLPGPLELAPPHAAIPLRRDPRLKRALDLVLASVMLVGSAPAWAAIAAAIKLEDGGPILYHQERWGRGGTTFWVKKFRTMIADSDRRFGVRQAAERDDRITGVGRVLRATGLDELPQVLNIWRGEMSFVGPRALATNEQDAEGNPLAYERMLGFAERLSVRPGLTGLATIFLPKDAAPGRKFAVDLGYVGRQSFLLDLRLIGLSFWISLRGRWETRGGKV